MDWVSLPNPTHLPAGGWGNEPVDAPRINDIQQTEAIDELPSFRHHPLDPQKDEIRILHLRGSPNGNDIPTGIIRHASLDSKPHYIALSYVWGTAPELLPILINGCRFPVGLNLYSALEHLQQRAGSPSHFIGIWIDAICINQQDNSEKSHQVQMMGSIYSSSQFTLSWLGPQADGSDLAIRALDYIGEQCLALPDGPAVEERCQLFARILSPPNQHPPACSFPVNPIVALLRRPYFRRIWIVQEVILPPAVFLICGDIVTTFGALAVGITALMELPVLLSSSPTGRSLTTSVQPLLPILNCDPRLIQAAMHFGAGQRLPLGKRLLEVTRMRATDERDHVFGLLGLVSRSELRELNVKADYGMESKEVFTQVSAALLKQGNRYLLSAACGAVAGGRMPSWVVDFSDEREGKPVPIWNPRCKLYGAGGQGRLLSGGVEIEGEGSILRVGGMVVDIVGELGPPPFQEEDRVGAYLGVVEEFARLSCNGYGSKEKLRDAIYRVPFFDMEVALVGETRRYNRRMGAKEAQGYFRQMRGLAEPLDVAIRRISIHAAAIAGNVNRQAFATERGMLGLGLTGIKSGDLVCVFRGCDLPFVGRKVGGGTARMTGKWIWKKQVVDCVLVGEAYVHGIMDGEGWDDGVKTEFLIH